jgi:hypothetical protein
MGSLEHEREYPMPSVDYLGEVCELRVHRYAKPANVCLRLVTQEGEPMATATVNPNTLLPEGIVAIKDYSENAGILTALEAAGVVEHTGESVPVGFAEAQLCRLLVK